MRAGKILASEPTDEQVEHQRGSVPFRIARYPLHRSWCGVQRSACGMRRATCGVLWAAGRRPCAADEWCPALPVSPRRAHPQSPRGGQEEPPSPKEFGAYPGAAESRVTSASRLTHTLITLLIV
eukprot:scaffold4812_cov88-Phaeocystis_antarctica.AAC.11